MKHRCPSVCERGYNGLFEVPTVDTVYTGIYTGRIKRALSCLTRSEYISRVVEMWRRGWPWKVVEKDIYKREKDSDRMSVNQTPDSTRGISRLVTRALVEQYQNHQQRWNRWDRDWFWLGGPDNCVDSLSQPSFSPTLSTQFTLVLGSIGGSGSRSVDKD